MNKWFCIFLAKDIENARDYKQIRKEITKFIPVIEFFYPVYFGKDEFKEFKKVLFDNYLFIKINEKHKLKLFILEKSMSIETIVTVYENNKRIPAIIDDDEICNMKSQLNNELEELDYRIGETVEVIEGMFKGIEGIIENINYDTVIMSIINVDSIHTKIRVEKICLKKI